MINGTLPERFINFTDVVAPRMCKLILTKFWTLFQSGEADYANHISLVSPSFGAPARLLTYPNCKCNKCIIKPT